MRLAIVSTHPIQYNAPLFKQLATRKNLDIRVFYSWEGTAYQSDPEFGKAIVWDTPLLEGYEWELVPNRAKDPGTHHFFGLVNPEMNERVATWKPDVILVYGWAWKTHLSVMHHFKGRCPVLFRGDSTPISGTGPLWKRIFRRPALAWIYRNIDYALYPGLQNRSYLRSVGVPPSKLAWMPHAIDTDHFSRNRVEFSLAAENERKALEIDPEDIVFLYAGKFVARKQCDLLIRAFLTASNNQKDIHLLLVGDGALKSSLKEIARHSENIHFLGFQNQSSMPIIYRMAETFVLPSNRETWGLSINEAMACGRTIIASDRVGAAPDLVRGKKYGQVFISENEASLISGLREFMLPRQKLFELGEAAIEESQRWSLSAAADAVESALGKFVAETV